MNNKTIPEVYFKYLDGITAISPEIYKMILDEMARELDRVNDEKFRQEVYEYAKTLPCDLDW